MIDSVLLSSERAGSPMGYEACPHLQYGDLCASLSDSIAPFRRHHCMLACLEYILQGYPLSTDSGKSCSSTVPVRTDSARSDKDTPRRSLASSIVESSLDPFLNSLNRRCTSSQDFSASLSLFLRSSFLVRPLGISHSHSNPRSSQNWHTGR
jgi:hypothetical protein